MAYKFLTRLGLLTGAIVVTTHMGVWSEPENISGSSKNANKTDADNDCRNLKELPIHEMCSIAQMDCRYAIRRGFYFSHRLLDWKKGFLKDTTKIINEHSLTESLREIQSSKEMQKESMRNSRFVELTLVKAPKPPMLKDDITCRKRELA